MTKETMETTETPPSVVTWTKVQVSTYLRSKGHAEELIDKFTAHNIDGKALFLLTESDLKCSFDIKSLGDLKRLMYDILQVQKPTEEEPTRISKKKRYRRSTKKRVTFESTDESQLSDDDEEDDEDFGNFDFGLFSDYHRDLPTTSTNPEEPIIEPSDVSGNHGNNKTDLSTRRTSGGYALHLKPEFFKAIVAMAYLFIVTWITALVMVIVHDRVPDMEKYPPLPDLFLDNMPHIPWAFEMCEVTGTILFCLWIGVLFFHKHRFILIRRFFALSGTVFLLRCVTMLITSLSVPGTHLKCNPRPYGDWMSRLYNAYLIWKGAGMSIQGVRTCGDYMFSGHTVALTMLNFFVTEYTTRRLYFIHTFSWLLNMFGIFFILAAHEHYSIDVFIAFYITSRLFLYYHTLANNQALMQRDSKRTKVWFPLFSYFESGVDGIVPNFYEWPITPRRVKKFVKTVSLTVERKYKGKFFTREGSSRGFGFFRTKVNAFIRPVVGGRGEDVKGD